MLKRLIIVLLSIGGVVFVPWLVTRYVIFHFEDLTYDPYRVDCIRYHLSMWLWGAFSIFLTIAVPIVTIAGIRRLIRYIKFGE